MTNQIELPRRNYSDSLASNSLEHLTLRFGTLCLQLLCAIAVVIYHRRAMKAAVCEYKSVDNPASVFGHELTGLMSAAA